MMEKQRDNATTRMDHENHENHEMTMNFFFGNHENERNFQNDHEFFGQEP